MLEGRMELTGKRILITGASGFVGSHLAVELRRQRAEVLTLVDRGGHPIDVRDWQRLRKLKSEVGRLDLIYHLAALTSIPYSYQNPREVYEVNVLGTLNILEVCRLHSVDKIVFASSCIYGHPQYLPIDEEHPLNPANPYARSKSLAENLCKAYFEDYGLSCIILRFFNIYGYGQGDNALVPSVLNQLADGKIEIMDAEPKRDFLYVKDAVEAYVKAGEYDRADFDIFNIGSGVSYSVDEIIRKILSSSQRNATVSYRHERRKNEIMNLFADVKKAKEKLGWEPKIDLEEGLRRYIEQYKRNTG